MRKYIVFQISAFLLLALAYSVGIQAQVNPNAYSTYDYTQKKTYNIGGIEIEGAKSRDPNAIKSIAKLREGRQITIPGDDVPNARTKWV